MGDVLKALGDVIRETAAQNHPDERKRGRIVAWIERHGGAVRKSLTVRVQKGRVKGYFRRNVNGMGQHWITFNPDQIKSALGNAGQFNSEDDSIVKALDGERVLAPNGGVVVFRDIEPVAKSVIRVRKAAFASPFPFGKPAGRMTVAEAVAAIRQAIATEHEAVAQYQALAESAADKDVREAFTSIADEERVHIGELEALLLKLAPSEAKLRKDGAREVTAEIAKALEACL